jgi:hypothetical protein
MQTLLPSILKPKRKKNTIANPTIPEVNAIKKNWKNSAVRSLIIQNNRVEIDGLMAMDVAHQILKKIGNNIIVR